MISKILGSILFIFLFSYHVEAMEACLSEQDSSLEGLLKVVKELKPEERKVSDQFCKARLVCMRYDFKPGATPVDFKCSGHEGAMISGSNCGMSFEERLVVSDYTNSSSGCMNSYLRGKYKNADMDFYIQTLNNALDKLPTYEGIVLRGANLPPEVEDQHVEGNIVTYDAFTSTSTSAGFEARDNFIIFSKTGRPVMGMSERSNEREILFRPGTKFKVLKVIKGEGGRESKNYYILKEVTCTPGSELEQKEDEILIQRIMNPSKSIGVYDSWACPEHKNEVPVSIQQEFLPEITIDLDN